MIVSLMVRVDFEIADDAVPDIDIDCLYLDWPEHPKLVNDSEVVPAKLIEYETIDSNTIETE